MTMMILVIFVVFALPVWVNIYERLSGIMAQIKLFS
jgi:hypothetical protein